MSPKRYLSGIDWAIHTLDYISTKRLGCGQSFQIVAELAGALNEKMFRRHLTSYCESFPHLWGSVRRAFNLAPYWRVAKRLGRPGVKIVFRRVGAFDEAFSLFCAELNTPFDRHEACLRVLCVRSSNKTLVGYTFDHRLFDARGGELFLDGFRYFLEKGCLRETAALDGGAGLDHWREKFAAGKKINRAHLASRATSGVRRFMVGGMPPKPENRFKIRHFDEVESQAIFERAEKRAGMFMFLPYALAVTIQMVHSLFGRRAQRDGDVVILVTRDLRSEGKSHMPIFFNHLSFIYFRVHPQETNDFHGLVGKLKQQLYEQVKDKLPEALSESSMLMRIVPKFALAWGFERLVPGIMPTFAFACLGQSAYQSDEFEGLQVLNMYHLPRIPPSPGLGIFFSEFRKTLTLTLSYVEGAVSEEEAVDLLSRVTDRL